MKEAFHKMIELRRSVRKFKQEPVDSDTLAKLVDAARLCPSAGNKQALVFIAVNEPSLCKKVFETEKFAAYLAGAGQPGPGQEPHRTYPSGTGRKPGHHRKRSGMWGPRSRPSLWGLRLWLGPPG